MDIESDNAGSDYDNEEPSTPNVIEDELDDESADDNEQTSDNLDQFTSKDGTQWKPNPIKRRQTTSANIIKIKGGLTTQQRSQICG